MDEERQRLREPISVLVVEDEFLVRMGIVDNLEDAGFRTVEAGSSADAIKVLESRSDIRVVFTDIEMPGTMDGLALSHYVRHRWPPTIIVISSGKRRPNPDELPANVEFISKPYHSMKLANVLQGIKRQLGQI
jgi:two-component system, response regulator PdtaR